MAKQYRHPYNRAAQQSRFIRPPLADWIVNQRGPEASYRYWEKLYWATPPWLTDKQYEAMKEFIKNCPAGYEVDHIVPLKSNLVCGLNVPWNLQYLKRELNQAKSNHTWPDSPHEHEDLFEGFEPWQMRLIG